MASLDGNVTSAIECLRSTVDEFETKRRILSEKQALFERFRSKQSSTSAKILKLNIGGKTVSVNKDVIKQCPTNSVFLNILAGHYDDVLSVDNFGRIFFDFDERYVANLLNLCYDYSLWNGDSLRRPVLATVSALLHDEHEAFSNLFQLSTVSIPVPRTDECNFFKDSTILQKVSGQALTDILKQRNIVGSDCILLYRGSTDGMSNDNFHKKCDGKEKTVCIVRDEYENVVGGYASLAWQSSDDFKLDADVFLFNLAKTDCQKFTVHDRSPNRKYSVRHSRGFGFCFGDNGCGDLCLRDTKLHGKLGQAFMNNSTQIATWYETGFYRPVKEIEVYQIVAIRADYDHHNLIDIDKAMVPIADLPQSLQLSFRAQYEVYNETLKIKNETLQLLAEAEMLLYELKLVLKSSGVYDRQDLCMINNDNGEPNGDSIDKQIDSVFAEIKKCICLIESVRVNGRVVIDTVTIATHNTTVTTAKATLRQAPEGSPLYNMASDEWGHDVDSDGNIYQDVNSDLLLSIINHLRLKVLLEGTSIAVPPISVYEDQKPALANLLAYYMLDELPIKTIAR